MLFVHNVKKKNKVNNNLNQKGCTMTTKQTSGIRRQIRFIKSSIRALYQMLKEVKEDTESSHYEFLVEITKDIEDIECQLVSVKNNIKE